MSSVPLSQENLARLPSTVKRPSYPRADVKEGIVHIGVGGFHRAHQALYVDDLLEHHGVRDWGICGMGIRAADQKMHDVLQAQNSLYALVEREGVEATARIIGAHTRSVLAPEDPEAAIEVLAAPSTRIVTLTITEAGYCCDDATGAFLTTHPDIVHDVKNLAAPCTAFGYLVAALKRRKERGLPPFTVLSCDNLEHNGKLTKKACVGFAELVDKDLAKWLSEKGAFPNSMVDRITPALTPADRAFVSERFGVDDQWPVVCEPFRQWVIEDRFACGRPPLELAGAQFTPDVAPYERMKLGLLNATHSSLAYLGRLAGFTFVHDVMNDPAFAKFLLDFMADEVTPILPPVPGVDLAEYRKMLVRRFSNVAIADTVARLEQNGSAKLPKFTFPSLHAQLAAGGPIDKMVLAIAGWCRYLNGVDDKGNTYKLDDTLAAQLQPLAQQGGGIDPTPLLGVSIVFGPDLPKNERFVTALKKAMKSLADNGAHASVKAAAGL
jgi:mannitol 2-dehydrogenase